MRYLIALIACTIVFLPALIYTYRCGLNDGREDAKRELRQLLAKAGLVPTLGRHGEGCMCDE